MPDHQVRERATRGDRLGRDRRSSPMMGRRSPPGPGPWWCSSRRRDIQSSPGKIHASCCCCRRGRSTNTRAWSPGAATLLTPFGRSARFAGREQQVVEQLRRQVRLEHGLVDLLESDVALEGEVPPGDRDRLRCRGRLPSSACPSPRRWRRVLRRGPGCVRSRPRAGSPEVGRHEGVDVDFGLEAVSRPRPCLLRCTSSPGPGPCAARAGARKCPVFFGT